MKHVFLLAIAIILPSSCSNKVYEWHEEYGDFHEEKLKGKIAAICTINYDIDNTISSNTDDLLKKKITSPVFNKCFKYDSLNNATEYYLIGLEGQEFHRTKVSYNYHSSGNILTANYYKENPDTNLLDKSYHFYREDKKYNNKGQLIYYSENNYEFKDFSETFLKYNKKGLLISKITKDSIGKVKKGEKTKFNRLRNKVRIKKYECPKKFTKHKLIYSYEVNKRTMKTINKNQEHGSWKCILYYKNDTALLFEFLNEKGDVFSYCSKEYNLNNCISKIQYFNVFQGDSTLEREYIYTCDSTGNWIEMIQYFEGKPISVAERSIEYR